MNWNNNRKSSNGRAPQSVIFGIIFALLGLSRAVPQLIPLIVIIAIAALVVTKRLKENDRSSHRDSGARRGYEKNNGMGKIIETKDITVDDDLKLENFKNKTDDDKRIDELKSLYVNGFMERDEYEEKRKKLTGSK